MEGNIGTIKQVMGPVVDLEFEPGKLPAILSAVKLTNPAINDIKDNLTVEVAQHLGENTVRCVAMDTTDGLARGMSGRDTGGPITMPVGRETLGRIEAFLIRRALDGHDGRRAATARTLGITREGLHKKMKRLRID